MKIYIFRHALADFSRPAPDSKHPENPPLTREGRAQVKQVTSLAREFGFKPNLIVSSPLVRAKETAEITKETIGLKSPVVVDECLFGEKNPEQVYQFLRKRRKSDQIVLVSHQPLIDKLTSGLLGGKASIRFINGAIACIEIDSKPARGKGHLSWLLPPGRPNH
ncbi:MAG: SixA phosphatase family protein [Nitrososphaerales archaeon]